MKKLKYIPVILLLAFSIQKSYAQRIKLTEGSLSVLKNEKSINVEFTYDNMKVGKFDKEEDYVQTKKEEYNKKEPGRGDNWAKSWVSDRTSRFEPKFNELFEKYSELSNKKDAKYTLILHTSFTEPGFNVGVMKRNAQINTDILIVETADHNKVIARITMDKVPGRSFWGSDFDTGERISECYADAGKALGKFINDKSR
jgi:hypothetical protein